MSEASTICPTWMLSWLSFTILNLPLPTCWIWARNTLLEPSTIHQLRTSSSSSLDCRCCFMPNKILSAVTPAIYCLLDYNNFCFKVLSNWCEKHCFVSRSPRRVITYSYSISKCQYPLVHFRNWAESINLQHSIRFFEGFKNCNILSVDKIESLNSNQYGFGGIRDRFDLVMPLAQLGDGGVFDHFRLK